MGWMAISHLTIFWPWHVWGWLGLIGAASGSKWIRCTVHDLQWEKLNPWLIQCILQMCFFHKKNAIAPMYIFIQVTSDMMTGTVPSSNGPIQKNKKQLRLCFGWIMLYPTSCLTSGLRSVLWLLKVHHETWYATAVCFSKRQERPRKHGSFWFQYPRGSMRCIYNITQHIYIYILYNKLFSMYIYIYYIIIPRGSTQWNTFDFERCTFEKTQPPMLPPLHKVQCFIGHMRRIHRLRLFQAHLFVRQGLRYSLLSNLVL